MRLKPLPLIDDAFGDDSVLNGCDSATGRIASINQIHVLLPA